MVEVLNLFVMGLEKHRGGGPLISAEIRGSITTLC